MDCNVDEEIPTVYRNSAGHGALYRCYDGRDSSSGFRVIHAFPEILEESGGETVVDIGCGYGSWLMHRLKALDSDSGKRPSRFVHVDSDPRVFDEAKRQAYYAGGNPYSRSGVEDVCLVQDAKDLSLPDASVQLVNTHYTFADTNMDFEDQVAAIKQIERVLVSGGLWVSDGLDLLTNAYYFPHRSSHDVVREEVSHLECINAVSEDGFGIFRKK